MKWIKFEPKKLNFIDPNNEGDNSATYIFRFKDKWNTINYFIGKLYKNEASEEIRESNYFGERTITIKRQDAKQWASNECPFGKYCDLEEIEIKDITHYIPLPKEDNEMD